MEVISQIQAYAMVALGVAALLGYVWHAYGNSRAPFSLRLLRTPTYKIGLLASLLGRIGSGMLPFMTPLFLQVGMGFSPFHAGLMMIPMIIGSMGMKRIVVQVVNRFGYRNVLVVNTVLRYATGASLQWANEVPELLFPWLVMSGVVLAAGMLDVEKVSQVIGALTPLIDPARRSRSTPARRIDPRRVSVTARAGTPTARWPTVPRPGAAPPWSAATGSCAAALARPGSSRPRHGAAAG